MSKNGWTCSICTFYHHAPAHNCGMCGNPRVTKSQMRDFILGKPIPDDSAASPTRKVPPEALAQKTIVPMIQSKDACKNKPQNILRDPPPKRPRPDNPYKKKASSAQTNVASTEINNTRPIINQNPAAAMPKPINPPPAPSRETGGLLRTLTGAPSQPLTNASSRNNRETTNRKSNHDKSTGAKPQPPTVVYNSVYQPGPVPVCPATSGNWIYPNDPNYPKRTYQFLMTQTALFHNTLVSLPTGLGKTLIAAVVMYNYYRWFPKGKVIFMAPTLPLVTQQVRACYDIMGIPEQDTALMTGKTGAEKRREIWQSQRVFFCTPQTVQNDLDTERLDSQKVVCIVLDEAHKATGDYAYCKVVQQLEAAGAKFRILGLSATPGSSIKGVQAVVEALRINKVEARTDDDPDVKQYINSRETEEIVVKQASAAKEVERKISEIVAPLLERLRSRGAMGRITGNDSLTHYTVLLASQTYFKRSDADQSLRPVFASAMTFVRMRDSLHISGIGSVRSAVSRIAGERKSTIMGKIAESKPFRELVDLVNKSSFDPMSKDQSAEQKAMNNPKLAKLREILVEHFKRAKSSEVSSRAIVFSQYRDSVLEIVDLLSSLKPDVRPRQFVGQGKGAQNEDGGRVKGMTQAEQQQVVKQFKENVYNVLVCTCIGEEGLDIGEVDLCVNFDTLKSPTRMIQRVGRTGRKRAGRVVCLMMEGHEQRKLKDAQRGERTIFLAMKKPGNFVVTQPVALLPLQPVLVEQNMQINGNFRMSQVEGHGGSGTGNGSRVAESRKSKSWRLTEDAEARRAAILGFSNRVVLPVCERIPIVLKKQILQGRQQQNHDPDGRLQRRLGRVSQALRTMESQNGSVVAMKSVRKRRRALNQTERYVDICFPLESSDKGFNKIAWGTESANSPKLRTEKRQVSSANHRPKHVPIDTSRNKGLIQEKAKPQVTESTDDTPSDISTRLSGHLACESVPLHRNTMLEHRIDLLYPQSESQLRLGLIQMDTGEVRDKSNIRPVGNGDVDVSANEEWRLPTPTSSSDEESLGEQEKKAPPQSTQTLPEIPVDNFSLPSQYSSSDESDAEEVEAPAATNAHSSGKTEHAMPTSKNICAQMRNIDIDRGRHGVEAKVDITNSISRIKARKRRVLDDSPNIAVFEREEPLATKQDTCGQQQLGVDEVGIAKKKMKKSRRVFEDSPEINQRSKRSSMGSGSIAKADPLIDTQPSPVGNDAQDDVDVVCGVCLSGDWVDEDPILLCDGWRGTQCDVAVHTSCYAVTCDWKNEEEWRCEACQYRLDGGCIKPRCYICCDTTGPLSRFLGSEWIHLRCKNSAEQPDLNMELEEASDMAILSDRDVQKRRRNVARAIRKDRYASFFDEEAEIASGDEGGDDEADEELARDIAEEEEEFHKDFINDSTQLGYATQDALDRLDSLEEDEHRAFDAEQALKSAYATPVLNRQMRQPRGARWSDVNENLPASLRGVGQMHFIRSVIEHHRQGGDADQIEQAYKELEMQATPVDEQGVSRAARAAAASERRKMPPFLESDSDSD
eukprot:scaffold2192_cov170-Amphora_coffeaeformis.AAC.12